ncbi:MAG: DUF342 domain-containing protein [Phycisphaerales bacterium]|nr:DUF342 domain-containing protein [Phycisphaerales bacterium]
MSQGECDLDRQLRLQTNPSKVEGTLHVEPLESVKGLDVDALHAFLIGNEVLSQYIDADDLAKLCEEVLEAPLEPHERVVARGEKAINGNCVTYTLTDSIAKQVEIVKSRKNAIKEGTFDPDNPPALEPEPDNPTAYSDETVNHYDQMAFVIVKKGDKIAMKSKRSDGFDGSDIFGKVIPAHEGKSNEGVLDASIHVASDGTCTSLVSGVLTAEPGQISVNTELEIKEDVDFQTGRIIFPGMVTVGGAVRDQFSVCAEGDILIRGLVEAANLESTMNISLARGMAGKDTGTITAGQNLEAGYLEAVIADVGGNVSVKGEITNSKITIKNELHAEHAAVRGGHVQASMGGNIGAIGSVQGVETVIEIGSLPEVESHVRAIDGFFERLESGIESQKSKIETYLSAIAKPTASQIEEQMGMQFEIDEMELRQKQLTKAKAGLLHILSKNTHAKLDIHKAIYSKVVIYLPGYRVEFPTELMGESTIELGQTGHPSITFRGKTCALSEHARVMSDDRILRVIQNEETLSEAA